MRYLTLGIIMVGLAANASAVPQRPSDGGAPGDSIRTAVADTTQAKAPAKDAATLKREIAVVGSLELEGSKAWQRRKSARTAMLSNMVMPGLGQLYNGRKIKTVVMVGLGTYYLAKVMTENRRKVRSRMIRDRLPLGSDERELADLFVDFHRENTLDFLWFSGAAWLIGVLDAFVDAHLFDVRAVDPAVISGTDRETYLGFSVRF